MSDYYPHIKDVALFAHLAANDLGELPDGAWFCRLEELVDEYNDMTGTNYDSNDAAHAYLEKRRTLRAAQPMKDDEKALLIILYQKNLAGKRCVPRDAASCIGIHPKRAAYICDKWSGKGWYDYGVSVLLGWLTDEGKIKARSIISNSDNQ